jgi:type IV pilus assembly protein PilB
MKKTNKDSKKIGNILMEAGLITESQLAAGIREQKESGARLGESLIKLSYITDIEMAQTLSTQLGIPYTDFETVVVDPMAIDIIPEKLAEKHGVIPLSIERGVLTVAMSDPLSFDAIGDMSFASDRSVAPTVSTAAEIKSAIKRYYHLAEPVHEILENISAGHVEVVTDHLLDVAPDVDQAARRGGSPPIIRMVNTIIFNAVKNRASDIHIEPRAKSVFIRERVDGLLHDVMDLPKWVQGAVTSRIKVLSKMDIAEKRVPQDGRIKIRIDGRDVDLRISVLPIQFGESIVIRILDIQTAVLDMGSIGLSARDDKRVKSFIEKPQGLVLITGPTGSGKTLTLYAIVNHIKSEAINIISLEDPIEYELTGMKQVSVNEKTGLTFAYGLRSVLRQDPDVIMVGEMRDTETANIAVQASLTGHLVLSTLHTNTAVAAIMRLRDMGVESYLIASAVNGIVAQRLLRRLCDKCKVPYTPENEELARLGLDKSSIKKIRFYTGKGCHFCNKTGYRGRIGAFEVMVVDKLARELIADDATEEEILKSTLDSGMRYMSQDGIDKVKQGLTSIEEVLRVLYVKEEKGVRVCRSCSESVRLDFLNCPYCGFAIVNRCPNCSKLREPDWKYCPYCR